MAHLLRQRPGVGLTLLDAHLQETVLERTTDINLVALLPAVRRAITHQNDAAAESGG
jgi:hypothetical protein